MCACRGCYRHARKSVRQMQLFKESDLLHLVFHFNKGHPEKVTVFAPHRRAVISLVQLAVGYELSVGKWPFDAGLR